MLGLCFFTYLFIINVAAYLIYAADKRRAHYDMWRFPESLLFGLAMAGGAYGAGAGMLLFRHKTLHRSFLITVPLCFVLWMVLLIILCINE